MHVQILSNFHGDDKRDIDTSTEGGRRTASQLIAELIKNGSALFLEKTVNGKDYTYRVTGYDEKTDKVRIALHWTDAVPEDAVFAKGKKKGGRPKKQARRIASVSSALGPIVSVAPVAGGLDAVEEEKATPSWKQIRYAIGTMCEERGWHHGVPLPSSADTAHRMVLARGTPFADQWGTNRPITVFPHERSVRVCSNEDIDADYETLINSWTPEPTTVQVYRDRKGVFNLRIPNSSLRLKFWLDSMTIRHGAMEWESELKAMQSLQEKITNDQWKSYILSGAFPETSKRSGVSYVLRKGLPTLAITEKPLPDGKVQRHFLCALCLHGLAYYEETWTGSQPPTDDVITTLQLIRADEHYLWRKSGQHSINDPRAGI